MAQDPAVSIKTKMNLSIIRPAADKLLQLVYPRVCPVCGRILTGNIISENNPYICSECYKKPVFPEEPRCLKCSRPVAYEGDGFCPTCLRSVRHFDRGISLLIHDDTAGKILYDLKYSNKRDNADMLVHEAAARYGELISRWDPDVLVPIPVYRKKKVQRGFNQAELLADLLSRYTGIPADPFMLIRSRETSPQKGLDRDQRVKNIRGAFEVTDGNCNSYRTVLLIDDIYTSGATISEAARILKVAGVETVYFLTFSIG